MQALSAVPAAQWCPSVSERASHIKHKLLLVGCTKTSLLTCNRKAHAPPSALPLKASVQDGTVTDDTPTEEAMPTDNLTVQKGSTTKVKFVLERKCNFGQRFNVVGNNAVFGNWDIEAAIPMEWTEGDIWSVEVDVPMEEQAVEFKFVLTGENGEVEWQPGTNRSLRASEGISFLVVNEQWEGVEESAMATPLNEVSNKQDGTTALDMDSGMLFPGDSTGVDGVLVPGDVFILGGGQPVSADATCLDKNTEEEVVKAFESSQVADEDPSKATSETEPELPLPELDVAVMAAKSALPSEDAPPES